MSIPVCVRVSALDNPMISPDSLVGPAAQHTLHTYRRCIIAKDSSRKDQSSLFKYHRYRIHVRYALLFTTWAVVRRLMKLDFRSKTVSAAYLVCMGPSKAPRHHISNLVTELGAHCGPRVLPCLETSGSLVSLWAIHHLILQTRSFRSGGKDSWSRQVSRFQSGLLV